MKGIILAGGKGKRLAPLTTTYPKPLLPILDKPVLEYNIELLKKHGIEEIAILIHHYGTEIKNYFGDGTLHGVKITYFEDNPPLGTAGSVKMAEDFVGNEPFLVVSGDVFTDFHLIRGVQEHYHQNPICTIFLTKVENPRAFGVVKVNQRGDIVHFLEKPTQTFQEPQLVNAGIYVCSPAILKYIPEGIFVDFGRHVFPRLVKDHQLIHGYVADGFWLDVGEIERFHQASMEVLGKRIRVTLHSKEVAPHMWIGENVEIGPNVSISPPVYIGNNVKIGENTVISSNSIIGENVTIEANSFIEEETVLQSIYQLQRNAEGDSLFKVLLKYHEKILVDKNTDKKNSQIAKR